jgi:hypothetical protein
MQERSALLLGYFAGAGVGNFLAVALAVIGLHDRSTGPARQLHLPLGSIARHDNRDGHPGESASVRQRLSEVT